ncbi:MAG TPA: 3-hydroxybutyrate dehydrogenase [Planctomycetota bacterium]|nr:3-hydroxybutyrate dehydrogenase [Planctomycetota bacterium]
MTETARTILITGAGSGLGRGLARCLCAAGHRLILADLNDDGLRETSALMSVGSRATTHVLDVTSSSQIRAFTQSAAAEHIGVLINNAGLQHVSPVESFPEERWDVLLDVMLKGPFLLSQALLPRMKANGFGRIVNIGSIHSLIASPYKSAYTAAKHGLLGLAKTIALECAGADITVNTICPAYVRTPLVDAQIAAQAQAHGVSEQEVVDKIMLEPMPKKAFITIDEIAAAVEFLIGHGARNITGQTLVIDGGWTAR